jgi:hypothetical protein
VTTLELRYVFRPSIYVLFGFCVSEVTEAVDGGLLVPGLELIVGSAADKKPACVLALGFSGDSIFVRPGTKVASALVFAGTGGCGATLGVGRVPSPVTFRRSSGLVGVGVSRGL